MEKLLIGYMIFVLAVIWPAVLICRRAGIKPVWAVVLFVPVFGLVIYSCALAFQPWPTLKKGHAK